MHLHSNILKITATLLACGIDPDKSILFQQSRVSMTICMAECICVYSNKIGPHRQGCQLGIANGYSSDRIMAVQTGEDCQ